MKTHCIVFPRRFFTAHLFFVLLAFAVSLPLSLGFRPPVVTEATCPEPENVVVTGKTFTSVSFSWDAVEGATGYVLKYVRHSDNFESSTTVVGGTSHTFTGLQEGVYDFYFGTNCGGDIGSTAIVITEDVIN